MADHDTHDHTGIPGVVAAITDIIDIPTVETDDTLVLAPDGAGGVEFRAEAGGGGGGNITSGTSFPGSPASGDLCFRTDRGILYFYDGTRWLSVQLYQTHISVQTALAPYSAGGSSGQFGVAFAGVWDLWLEDFITNSAVITTNDGSNYWTIAVTREPSGTSLASYTTAADAVNTNVKHVVAIDALHGTSDGYFSCNPGKTGAPGVLYMQASVTFRLVG